MKARAFLFWILTCMALAACSTPAAQEDAQAVDTRKDSKPLDTIADLDAASDTDLTTASDWDIPSDSDSDTTHGDDLDIHAESDAPTDLDVGSDTPTDLDVGTEDLAGDGEEAVDPCPPEQGGLGCPCSLGDDCASGYCTWASDEQVCTVSCDEGCPDGWDCHTFEQRDSVSLCLPANAVVCRPCTSSEDCVEDWVAEAFCLDLGGAQGSFCGAPCGEGDTCPDGTACLDATSAEGDLVRQCVPDDGSCDCSAHAIETALSTPCSRTNQWGTCLGFRVCEAAGLTDCDAPEAQEEICGDGIDQDCDGQTDEGFPDTDESCDGVDDDCDGLIDEDFSPTSSTCGVGACEATGELICQDGTETDTCTPGQPLADVDTTCDGADDDCNGDTDEDYETSTSTCGVGACEGSGTLSCVDGAEVDSCSPGSPASNDATCDGIDEDCDGTDDEDYAPSSTTCGIGACEAAGNLDCTDGLEVYSCQPGTPEDEDAVCDGVDEDCDGMIDEDYESAVVLCGEGACLAYGTTVCQGGVESDSCQPLGGAGVDLVCNGIDDDCDDQTDEDYVETTSTCGFGGCAAAGTLSCVNGAEVDSCVAGTPAAEGVSCDGVDDDCDGALDEDYVRVATDCGVGACAATGEMTCQDGAEIDTCVPEDPAEDDTTCDGVDDDCDDEIDEDYRGHMTSCATGSTTTATTRRTKTTWRRRRPAGSGPARQPAR